MKNNEHLKVALVHDFLVQYGGAEKVLEELCRMFPDAPVYTLLHEPDKLHGKFSGRIIRTSRLQKLPRFIRRRRRWLLPLFTVMPEVFDLREYDLVISSSGAWSKGLITRLDTVHVAYLHSPMRFVWDYNRKYLQDLGHHRMPFWLSLALNYVRIWDRLAAERPDYLISNSEYTRQRVAKYYRRESRVIYPPAVRAESEDSSDRTAKGDYFLIVSRLAAYKRLDIAVEAFNKLNLPLIIVGEGDQAKRLKKMAKGNIRFVGWQDETSLMKYFREARALIFPGEEDFGLTMTEALSHGTPVIAYGRGGATEIVTAGITGELFEAQTPEILASAVRTFLEKEDSYDAGRMRNDAGKFSDGSFRNNLQEFLGEIIRSV